MFAKPFLPVLFIWGESFKQKNNGRKSRETVPLRGVLHQHVFDFVVAIALVNKNDTGTGTGTIWSG